MVRSLTVEISANIANFLSGIDLSVRGLQNLANQAAAAGGSLASGLQSGLGSATRSLGQFSQEVQKTANYLTVGLSAPLALLGRQSLDTFGEMDALRRGLATLEKDGGSLTKRLAELNEIAKLPGLGNEEAIKFDVLLRNAGFSADLSKRSMLAFGNALGSIGRGKTELAGVANQLQQMAGKTQGYGQDLKIIKEYAPQVNKALMDAFGTNNTEAIAKLGVSGKEVISKIVDELAKLPKATGGAKNTFENFGDTTGKVLDKIQCIRGDNQADG